MGRFLSPEIVTRLKSLAWRIGTMALAMVVNWLATNIGLFNLNPQVVVIAGLVLGEISKHLNNRYKAQQ